MRRFHIIPVILLVLFCQGVLLGQQPGDLFRQARQSYDAGDYQKAITLYQKVLQQGQESAALHYNLGNAYFKMNAIGEAILHYEKAKRLAPRDRDIQFNLKVARLHVQDRITAPEPSVFMRIFNGLKYFLNLNELGWVTAVLFLIGSLLFALWRIGPDSRLRTLLSRVLVGWLVLFLLVAPLLLSRTLEAHQNTEGIVLTQEVKARSAPQDMSTEVFILHEGTKLQVEDTQYNWYKIKLPDEKEGWVHSDTIGII